MKKFLQKCKSKPLILWILLVGLFLTSTVICVAVIGISGDYTVLRICVCMGFPIFHLWIFSAPLTRYEKWNLVFTYVYVSNLFVFAIRSTAWSDLAVWICMGFNTFWGALFWLTLFLDMRAHDKYEREYREILYQQIRLNTDENPRSKS